MTSLHRSSVARVIVLLYPDQLSKICHEIKRHPYSYAITPTRSQRSMIQLKNITLQVADKVLLEDTHVRIDNHQRVGLVGRNGSGKSSLIKAILEQSLFSGGQLDMACPSTEIGYLEQSLPTTPLSAIEFVKTGDHQWLAVKTALEQAEAKEDGEAIAMCYANMEEIDAYTMDTRASTILGGLGFSQDQFCLPINNFSGGWQMRLQLGKLLLSRASLLLLDEPTNHLDINAIIWLASWLKQLPSLQIIISHDREFLDEVCTHTLHLANQTLKLYTGNFSSFQKQYAETQLVNERTQKKAQEKRKKTEIFINRFRAKSSKAKQVQSRIKALEKLESGIIFQDESVYPFHFLSGNPVDGPIITMNAVHVGYPNHSLLPQLNFSLYAGDRIGIVGKNGIGKTTLLNTLAAKNQPIAGEIIKHHRLKIGYYAQNQADQMDTEESLLSTVLQDMASFDEKEARAFLGRIGFSGNRVLLPIKQLSGGERTRLGLSLLGLKKPNLLILDEPTNHLDLESKEALILSLLNFNGALIVVSHDRYFMSSLVNQIYHIAEKQLTHLENNDWQNFYSDSTQNTQSSPSSLPTKAKKKGAQLKQKKQPTQHDKKALTQIEKKIEATTRRLQAMEDRLSVLSTSCKETNTLIEYQKLNKEYQKTNQDLKKFEEEWLKLAQ